jgi:dTDP-4-amino-4,6-dideoxygalactose transaminase
MEFGMDENGQKIKSVPFCRILCDGHELEYVREVLDSGWLTTAGKAQKLEKLFAEAVGAKFACAVNSATAALHLASDAVGIKRGDKVLVPTMTFTASAEVIRYLGADPILLDVDYGTCMLTPEILLEGLKQHPDTKAVMIVHYGGQAAEMVADGNGILEICQQHGLKLIEDAAHAFPSKFKGRMIGTFGDATCFSFYANKTITTAEGGMLVTDDEAIYKRAKVMRLHGINRDVWDRFTAKGAPWEYDVIAPGFKYNMPDLNAAIGLAQLERAEELRQGRQRCAEYYLNHLRDMPEVDLPVCNVSMNEHSWHLFPIVLTTKSKISRNIFIEKMSEASIGTSVHYKPLHRMTYYKERYKLLPEQFPVAEQIWQGNVSLPIFPSMSGGELAYVCETIKRLVLKGA